MEAAGEHPAPGRSGCQVVVPWGGGCPHRHQALGWVQARLRWPLVPARGHEPWVKANAVMPAIERCDADVVVMHDADVYTDGLEVAIQAVVSGASWAVPHTNVHRLSEEGTAAVLGGAEWRSQALAQRPYKGIAGGGVVVATREVFLSCPLDPRFIGWGSEDESWGWALQTLHGPPWRGEADLVHLWHPPQRRLSRARGSHESWKLRRRYIEAASHHQRFGSTREMEGLLNESRTAFEQAGHPVATGSNR